MAPLFLQLDKSDECQGLADILLHSRAIEIASHEFDKLEE